MKKILIIDDPGCCEFCMLCGRGIKERFCIAKIYEQEGNTDNCDVTELDKVLKDCPLKPMPQKMKVDYDTITSGEVTEKVVAMGWNDCINTILGAEND